MNAPEPTVPARDSHEVEIAKINSRQIILAALITAVSGIAGALIQGSFASRKTEDLENQVSSRESTIERLKEQDVTSTAEREALYRLTADRLDDDLSLTQGKASPPAGSALSETELGYRMLRRAVFLNMTTLQANQTILEKTLDTLSKRGRSWVVGQQARIVAEFPGLKAARLRWLEDVAIPALQQAIRASSPVMQSVPHASVKLPDSVLILDQSGDEPTVVVSSMSELQEEVDLLKGAL